MAKYYTAHTDPNKELENAFAMFDKDKNGFVDINELKYALTHLGEKLTQKEVERMFKDVDVNKDGKLHYKGNIQLRVLAPDISCCFYLQY